MPVEVRSPITSSASAKDPALPLSPGARSMPGRRTSDSVPAQGAHGSSRGAHAEEVSTARIHGPQEE
jgi:hypothetical protein